MKKKIILTENNLVNIKKLLNEEIDSNKLPSFIFKRLKNHNTSLGDNLAFPPEDEYSFDYKILKSRFIEVKEKVKLIEDVESLEESYLLTYLGKLIKECREIERPIRESLVKICENSVIKLLNVPEETVNLTCQLVDKIAPNNPILITPESSDDRSFDFEDLNEMDEIGKIILKRRLINSLIQGASYEYSQNYELYLSDLFKLNKKLPDLYDKIITINDYLLFIKEEEINDEKLMQGAYVEVILGRGGEKSEINSQGLLFPYLLAETIRGFFELFASHGLPEDNQKAMYIIKQSDFLLAEPWDLRMGVELWRLISYDIHDTSILPYFFTTICELPVNDFNDNLKEVFAKTKKGKGFINELINDIEHSIKFNNFTNAIKLKNMDHTLMSDGYFSGEELNDYVIEEEDNDNDSVLTIDDYKNVNPQNINFEVGDNTNTLTIATNAKRNQYQIYPVINNIEVPVNLINFQAEERLVQGEYLYQLHLTLDKSLQHIGLGFKLYYAFILTYGIGYSSFRRRANNVEIPKIWDKLSKMNNIRVSDVKDKLGNVMGVKAELIK